MGGSEDKHWASRYLLDPLNAPEPSAETGPGTHYNSTFAPQTQDRSSGSSHTEPQQTPPPSVRTKNPSSSQRIPKTPPSVSIRSVNPPSSQKPTPSVSERSSNNPYRNASSTGYPSPPQSVSPRKERFSTSTNGREAFPDFDGAYSPTATRRSMDQASSQIPTSTGGHNSTITTDSHRRRGSSLNQRYPGDQSHRPLDTIKKETKAANRHPHLRKKHMVGSDTIDRMDTLGNFHHEGPYDATLLARNMSSTNSPVEAVRTTNQEALRATPREMIKDSVEKHRPLDGVAMTPPGTEDRYGNVYNYDEGTDMMIEDSPGGGAYKRWPGVQYLPEDLKGKGEPSYSLETALKQHKLHSRHASEGGRNAIEMTKPATQRRPMSVEGQSRPVSDGQKYADWEQGVRRSSSGAGGKLRKRFGSLRIGKDGS